MAREVNEKFINEILVDEFGDNIGKQIISNSPLIRYLIIKTRSVNKSSKARGSFASLYAIYVLVEDYINEGFHIEPNQYSDYEGMMFSDAFRRQRQLPFGEKLQNHALNNRCNDEFRRYFLNETQEVPIIRDVGTGRYWINEALLVITTTSGSVNIANAIIRIIDRYIELKLEGFQQFFNQLEELKATYDDDAESARDFILTFLNPQVDARIFEIVSFGILKYHYIKKSVLWGPDESNLRRQNLVLYKTGRTNANDGGIDFIMIPTGRIFQVTEVLDFKKYFLDIDKINRFPITFVVKQTITPEEATDIIVAEAKAEYTVTSVLNQYLECFEEVITIPTLSEYLDEIILDGRIEELIDELIIQCKVEYNIEDESDDESSEE